MGHFFSISSFVGEGRGGGGVEVTGYVFTAYSLDTAVQ